MAWSGPSARARYAAPMSPTWIWMQVGIVLAVLAGFVIAIVKLL
jgi:hypothetical protein